MTAQTVLTVGVGEEYSTINAAIKAAEAMGGNADIKVDAGTYTNDGGYIYQVNNVTVEGVGGMVNIVDPTYYAGGKAAIVANGQNIELKNLNISGIAVPDGNGAGVRYDQGSLTLDNVVLHGNQNGILAGPDATGSIMIENSEIYGNGTSAGNTHNIYIGDVAQFTLTQSYIHDANVGHEVKSRAQNTTITNNVIADNSGTSSYSIDLPNGGNATITGNTIEQGPNGANHIINAYGEEGASNSGTAVTFSNNTVLNDNAGGGGPLWANNGGTITGSGNSVYNLADLGTGVAPSGYTTLTSEPTINTSNVGLNSSAATSNPTPTPAPLPTPVPTPVVSTPTPVPTPTPLPTPVPSTVTAQTVLTVGVGEEYSTINAAIKAAEAMGGNADIKVDAGTYTNDGGYIYQVNNVTVEGVGGMVNIVDPTYYAGGKAAIVANGQNIELKNLNISGIAVPDGNGAGVRYDQGSLTLDNVVLHGNQNGILAGPDATGSIMIENSEIYGNGTSAGNTHNIYIGDVAQFTLTQSYIHDANVGHEVKSRAQNTTITNNVIADNSGTSSYSIDLPNGGNATITGNTIEQGPNGANHIINAYGEEGASNSGTAVTFSNNTVLNDNAGGGGPLWANNGGTITGSGNSVYNLADLGTGVAPSGYTTLTSEPTINTSNVGLNSSAATSNPTPTPAPLPTPVPTPVVSTPTPVPTPTPLPTPVPSTVTAQTVLTVGVGEEYSTINAAIKAAEAMGGNADIKVDAGTYTNDGGYIYQVNNVTVEGVGGMVNIVDPTYYAGGKAAIVANGQNIELKNLNISGIAVPDGNGAGVRYDQGSLTLDNVVLHGNQNGILAGPDATGSIMIENSEIYGNGTSAGNTHNIYIGDVAQFTLTQSYIHDANVGHEVKSRAQNTTITNNVIADNSGTSSYSIDLPNGGNATITGNTIEQGPNGANHIINAYGEEGASNSGTAVTFSNNTVLNDNAGGGGPLWANNGGTITGSGNSVYNLADLGTGVAPSGYTTLTSEPTINTSNVGLNSSAATSNPTPTPAPLPTPVPTPVVSTPTPVPTPTPTGLVLQISEDAWQGDAQYTISIDGNQVGGVHTASASHAAGQTENISVAATAGGHIVGVDFLNDAYGGSAATDRNLYLDGATVGGQSVPGSTIAMGVNGSSSFAYTIPPTSTPAPLPAPTPAPAPTPTPVPTPTPTGLVLQISEDAWQGDAQYTISIDGNQVGGVHTASASHAAGQTENISVAATAGGHIVGVDFLNDAYGGSAATDRNLYLDGATVGGQSVPGSTIAMGVNGSSSFAYTIPPTSTPAPLPAPTPAPAPTPTPVPTPTPTGLVLQISEDAWQGDAQYTISIDGNQVGGVHTASASHAAGQTENISVAATAGGHIVGVDFLNDAYGGSAATDRNLYLDGATVGGQSVPGSTIAMGVNGSSSFAYTIPPTSTPAPLPAPTPAPAPTPTPVPTPTPTGLVLQISEDAWQGDAQYTISIDGNQVGGVHTASASHAAGQTENISVAATAGGHIVGVDFLNDAYGGSAATDRNLYLDGATVGGQSVPGSTIAMGVNGSSSFAYTIPPTSTPAPLPAPTPAPAPTPTPVPTPTPTGLVLQISEDAWQGDAQYTISIDGNQVGGVHTASASHAAGQTENISVAATAGGHIVGVDFLNDAYGGSAATDRNLYLDGASINGQTLNGAASPMFVNGTSYFGVTVGDPSQATPAASTSNLVLNVSEDAWQGDAQFAVVVDGTQIGGIHSVSASHAAGQTQAISVPVTADGHTVALNFLNDAYGGSPAMDRNLYLDSATVGDQSVPGSTIAMMVNGSSSFSYIMPHH